MTNQDQLQLLAPDLTKEYPRSPRETLGNFVIAGRTLDKCRALLVSRNGEYHFDCPLDNIFFDFAGLGVDAFKEQAATGATDDEMAEWIRSNTTVQEKIEIIRWNNEMRTKRLCELPDKLQIFLEDYIPQFIPRNRPVYCWFDVYDLEEQRI
jgi:hypothetical protein